MNLVLDDFFKQLKYLTKGKDAFPGLRISFIDLDLLSKLL